MANPNMRHPGKTKAQRTALNAIGCGQQPFMSKRTRDALLAAGLIYKCGERKIGDGWSAIYIDEYEMSTIAHIQWCEYYSLMHEG